MKKFREVFGAIGKVFREVFGRFSGRFSGARKHSVFGKVFSMVFGEISGRTPSSNKEIGCLTSSLCRWLLDMWGRAGLLWFFGKCSIWDPSGSFSHDLGVDPGPPFTTKPAFREVI